MADSISGPRVCNSRNNNNHNCNTDRHCGDTFKKDPSVLCLHKTTPRGCGSSKGISKHVSCSLGNWASHILQQWDSMGSAFLLNLRSRGVIAACPTRGSGSHGLLLRDFATACRISSLSESSCDTKCDAYMLNCTVEEKLPDPLTQPATSPENILYCVVIYQHINENVVFSCKSPWAYRN